MLSHSKSIGRGKQSIRYIILKVYLNIWVQSKMIIFFHITYSVLKPHILHLIHLTWKKEIPFPVWNVTYDF